MTVFIDSSAIYAHYDADDKNHATATAVWGALLRADAHPVPTGYVLIEAAALLQRRLGLPWVALLQTEIRPLLDVVWVDEELHDFAVAAALTAGRRQVSIVDHLSLEVIKRRNIKYALAFDRHFEEAGCKLPPLSDEDQQEIPE